MGVGSLASGQASLAGGTFAIARGASSLAFGRAEVLANAHGSFAWGDLSTSTNVQSDQPGQFIVRAAGGVRFATNPGQTTGVILFANASAWSSLSDVNSKEHFRDLADEDVLTKIANMPVREWSYKAQGAAIRHMGPTAQDFHAAFGLGEDPLRISTIDADGVALAAARALEAARARPTSGSRANSTRCARPSQKSGARWPRSRRGPTQAKGKHEGAEESVMVELGHRCPMVTIRGCHSFASAPLVPAFPLDHPQSLVRPFSGGSMNLLRSLALVCAALVISLGPALAQTSLTVSDAELAVPFGAAKGHIALVGNQILFVAAEDPKASLAIDRADIAKLDRSGDVVTVTTRRSLGDRDAFRFRLAQPGDLMKVVRRGCRGLDVADHANRAGRSQSGILASFQAKHDHRLGSCRGTVVLTNDQRGLRVDRHHQRLAQVAARRHQGSEAGRRLPARD